MKPGDNMTDADAEAVKRAKDSLMIGYATGDSAESVTQNVSLPTGGANGVSVSWASSDAARISTTGMVTQPIAADTEVTLTATLTKNDTSDTRSFTLTVVALSPCGTSDLVAKLKADPPSLSGCSAASIRGADMPALVSAGVTKEQLLAVWSADADTGFTPAQLKEAGVTVAEMRSHGLTIAQIHTGGVSIADLRSGGVADHLVFNEACNTSSQLTSDTTTSPRITGVSLVEPSPDNNNKYTVVLEAVASVSITWTLSVVPGRTVSFNQIDSVNDTKRLGTAIVRFTSKDGSTLGSTLSIPLVDGDDNPNNDVFSNPSPTVIVSNVSFRNTSIQLCPCASQNPPSTAMCP